MARRWVHFEGLGSRMNWQSLKRKSLEALGNVTESAIKNGRMDRASRSALVEFSEEEQAERVARFFDGYHDKVTSQKSNDVWTARAVDEAASSECMPSKAGVAGGGSFGETSPPPRRSPRRQRSRSPVPRPRSWSPEDRRGRRRSTPPRRSSPRRHKSSRSRSRRR
eukprot:TRINITY_DN20700_c0_g1_i1.p1 TRINITY_DN20700_c0_g1~~TRINITY_DN20700_c0_g1_i1.p1  ORF type:complete len:191 (-),score=24.67 TRINITY_DN20700_c0_g1_i1:240-737(-)